MPGPRRTLDEYVADRIRELQDLGGAVDFIRTTETPKNAIIHASVSFGEHGEGILIAYEHLRMKDERPHRFKYGYRVSHGDDYLFAYHRDPTAHPEMPQHKHVAGSDRRFPTDRMTLHEVAEELWDVMQERATVVDNA
jgi:hypothetical protein